MKCSEIIPLILVFLATTQAQPDPQGVGDEDAETIYNRTYSEHHTLLERSLFKGYNPNKRPVKNESTPLEVDMWWQIGHISINEQQQTMTVHGNVYMTWIDQMLGWDIDEYNGIRTIKTSKYQVWHPKLTVANSVSGVNTQYEVMSDFHSGHIGSLSTNFCQCCSLYTTFQCVDTERLPTRDDWCHAHVGQSTAQCCSGKHIKARQRESHSSGEEENADVLKDVVRRKRRANPMIQSTKRKDDGGKRNTSSSSDGDDMATNVSEHAFAASGSAAPLGPQDLGATATLDIDTEAAIDAQSQFERVQTQLKEGIEKDGKVLYKGQAMYGAKEAQDTIKENASSTMARIGPARAPQFLRQTVRWDFAPDICKDYKETGFCTFGDSCKFLHDRSDYKHGWELERDFESGEFNKVDEENYEIPEEEDELPEECFICGNAFENPIVTRCKHYFCEACAIKEFKKSKKCRICNQNTGGMFNVAKDLIQKINGTTRKKTEPEDDDSSEEDAGVKEEPAKESDDHVHGRGRQMNRKRSSNEQEEVVKEEVQDEDEEETGQTMVVNENSSPEEEVEIAMEELPSDDEASGGSGDNEDDDFDEGEDVKKEEQQM